MKEVFEYYWGFLYHQSEKTAQQKRLKFVPNLDNTAVIVCHLKMWSWRHVGFFELWAGACLSVVFVTTIEAQTCKIQVTSHITFSFRTHWVWCVYVWSPHHSASALITKTFGSVLVWKLQEYIVVWMDRNGDIWKRWHSRPHFLPNWKFIHSLFTQRWVQRVTNTHCNSSTFSLVQVKKFIVLLLTIVVPHSYIFLPWSNHFHSRQSASCLHQQPHV